MFLLNSRRYLYKYTTYLTITTMVSKIKIKTQISSRCSLPKCVILLQPSYFHANNYCAHASRCVKSEGVRQTGVCTEPRTKRRPWKICVRFNDLLFSFRRIVIMLIILRLFDRVGNTLHHTSSRFLRSHRAPFDFDFELSRCMKRGI